MNYYYLAAILPTLTWGEAPALSRSAFAALCGEHLSPADAGAAAALLASDMTPSRHRFVREWQHTEARLRNAVAKLRAKRVERDAEPYLKTDIDYGPEEERAATEAFAKQSPLAREEVLDHFRWRKIEEMAGFDPFTSRAMLAYVIKFKLCDRWAAMDRERGEEKADELINQKET